MIFIIKKLDSTAIETGGGADIRGALCLYGSDVEGVSGQYGRGLLDVVVIDVTVDQFVNTEIGCCIEFGKGGNEEGR
ncbi:MAG: hypothetical protein EZS28_007832 [Streblomastix strix]|uniref:Uncharacterized protein n=1 Tax=Streblomastix strix TaxID=222440 RepID=A0A5J4WPZ9_9EUKA|nr:MAG: hypothetical protein EZS28_007832 [Streblomastix strix]